MSIWNRWARYSGGHGGAEGVRQVVEMIVNELCYDMRSVGAQCLDDLGPLLIVKAPTA